MDGNNNNNVADMIRNNEEVPDILSIINNSDTHSMSEITVNDTEYFNNDIELSGLLSFYFSCSKQRST